MELTQKINKKEIEAITKLGAFERYKYLIKRIAAWDKIYILENKNEDIAIEEIKGNFLIPIWSAREYAESFITEEWKNYLILEIYLSEFKKNIISIINKNKYLLDVFPINNKSGFVVDIDEFLRDLNEELDKYE